MTRQPVPSEPTLSLNPSDPTFAAIVVGDDGVRLAGTVATPFIPSMTFSATRAGGARRDGARTTLDRDAGTTFDRGAE